MSIRYICDRCGVESDEPLIGFYKRHLCESCNNGTPKLQRDLESARKRKMEAWFKAGEVMK